MQRLSFETARALEDAGFPDIDLNAPDTFDLIEATRVQVLKRDPIVGWWADHCTGKTPDEALAALWLDRQSMKDEVN